MNQAPPTQGGTQGFSWGGHQHGNIQKKMDAMDAEQSSTSVKSAALHEGTEREEKAASSARRKHEDLLATKQKEEEEPKDFNNQGNAQDDNQGSAGSLSVR